MPYSALAKTVQVHIRTSLPASVAVANVVLFAAADSD
jgi:hypothetical protein